MTFYTLLTSLHFRAYMHFICLNLNFCINIACTIIMNSNRVRKVEKSIYVEVLDKYMNIDKMRIRYISRHQF